MSAFAKPLSHEEQLAFPSDMSDGMSLRDYFAGQVIAMLIVHGTNGTVEDEARAAYAAADAMLVARAALQEAGR